MSCGLWQGKVGAAAPPGQRVHCGFSRSYRSGRQWERGRPKVAVTAGVGAGAWRRRGSKQALGGGEAGACSWGACGLVPQVSGSVQWAQTPPSWEGPLCGVRGPIFLKLPSWGAGGHQVVEATPPHPPPRNAGPQGASGTPPGRGRGGRPRRCGDFGLGGSVGPRAGEGTRVAEPCRPPGSCVFKGKVAGGLCARHFVLSLRPPWLGSCHIQASSKMGGGGGPSVPGPQNHPATPPARLPQCICVCGG